MTAIRSPKREPVPVKRSSKKPGTRKLAALATRDSILRAATKVFARFGYDGGSLEKISRTAKSYDRMVYYYFGSKEGLFIAVLEDAYRRFNDAESTLDLNIREPVESLVLVIRFIIHYYRKNPEFVTLLNTENLHRGKHIAKSERAREYSSPAIAVIDQLLQRGSAQKLFRCDITARDLYLMIVALGYFYQSNRFTLSAFLGENLERTESLEHWESFVIDTVMRAVALDPRSLMPA